MLATKGGHQLMVQHQPQVQISKSVASTAYIRALVALLSWAKSMANHLDLKPTQWKETHVGNVHIAICTHLERS